MLAIPNVLTIAGTDPSGGAGIMADVKTFGALRTHGCAVITAVVAQNTQGVADVTQLSAQQVHRQLENLLDDVRIDALKIGMLGSRDVIDAVVDVLTHHPALRTVPRVLDPVMVASSGDRLIDEDAVAALRERLLPVVDLFTPNLAEAAVLLERDVRAADEETARELAELGAGVLLKGGHAGGDVSDDVLLIDDEVTCFTSPRIATTNSHGTGCTLSAAITALRPQRDAWKAAVGEAKTYLTGALQAADQLDVGRPGGHGPVHHFYRAWGD